MPRRNPQETIATLKDDLAEKDEYIEQLEDERDRLVGRLKRISSAAEIDDIIEDDESESSDTCENCDGEGCEECEPDEE